VNDTPCAGRHLLWNDIEASVEGHTSPQVLASVAAQVIPLCSRCTIVEQCYQWARSDRYTGVAGGTVFKKGEPRTRLLSAPPARIPA